MGTDDGQSLEGEFLWSAVAATVFAGAAGLFAIPFIGTDEFWPPFSSTDAAVGVASILAAATVGWASWFTLAALGMNERPLVHGTVAGVITGIVAHPVMWFLWPLLPPTHGMAWSAFIMPLAAFWSLLFVGWITVPLAVAAGVATGAIRLLVISR